MKGLITKRVNKLQTSELQEVFNNNDIICLTETWGDSSQQFDVDGFSYFELHRTEKKANTTRNSGGVMVFIRNEFVFDDTLFLKCSDTHIWLKLRHECFDFENDLYLCLCYIMPSNSSRQSINEVNVYDEILQNIIHIQNTTENACNFLLLGDLNSRIGQECDYVTYDSDTHVNILPDDYVCDQEIPRKSQDNIVNYNGHLLLDFFKTVWASYCKR